MSATPTKVLLIEDNSADALLLQEMLLRVTTGTFELIRVDRMAAALDRLTSEVFDAILLDLSLPDSSGLTTLEHIQEAARGIPTIILTAVEDEELGISAIRHDAQDYLLKGTVDGHVIAKAIRYAIDRKKADEALRKSEAAYTAAKTAVDTVNAMSTGVVLADMNGRIISVNPAFEKVTGYGNYELAGKDAEVALRLILDPEDIPRAMDGLVEARNGKSIDSIPVNIAAKNGSKTPIIAGLSHIKDAAGVPSAMVFTISDISDLKQAQQALEVYQVELRALASSLTLAEERARRQLAIALHDTVGQTLALINIKLGSLGQLLTEKEPRNALAEIRKMFEEAVLQTRTLSFELSPPILYELGLGAAIEWLGEDFAKRYGFQVHFHGTGWKCAISETVSVLFFQSARELLTNIAKHSGASMVYILLKPYKGRIVMKISDNGKGMECAALGNSAGVKKSLGLFSIRERMNHIGGNFEIQSKPGHGTIVTLTSQIQDHENPGADIGG